MLLALTSAILLDPSAATAQRLSTGHLPSGPERGPTFARAALIEQDASALSFGTGGGDRRGRRHLKAMALGFAASILAHEAGHVAASLAVGARPSVGLDKGRPVVYSGIDPKKDPDKQLLFSSAGLVVQIAIDELILDIPGRRGGSFERGVLAGGIGTGLFYAIVGRNSAVSDVSHIAANSGLSKAEVGLILGSVSALHALRVSRDERYANFFAAPGPEGELRVGVLIAGP